MKGARIYDQPVRIVLGIHPALGLIARTPDASPGTEQKLLRRAGFTTEPGTDLYTLANLQAGDQDIRTVVGGLLTEAHAAGIRVTIDPVFAPGLGATDPRPPQPGSSPKTAPSSPRTRTTDPDRQLAR